MVDNFYSLSSSFNPWSTTDGSVAGMQLGDPESGLVIARRHDLLPMEVCLYIYVSFSISVDPSLSVSPYVAMLCQIASHVPYTLE